MGYSFQGSGGGLVTLAGGPQLDGFGRLRVAHPATLFDSKQLWDAAPLFWDDSEVSGGSTTSAHDTDEAMTTIGVANTTAGKRVRQTFMRFNYQPGKSQLILMTGVLGISGGGTGVTREMGAFDDNNGIFAQDDEGTVKMVVRSKVTGSVVDNKIAQSSWNGDKLDGGGVSGKTLDATKVQIWWCDFEWLGVGSVRTGFVIDGEYILCHTFHHANTSSLVYMSTPNLPLRYSIENDGTGAASSLGHICSTVITEGGQTELGILRHVGTDGTHVDATAVNVLYAIIGIRLKSTHLDAVVKLVGMSMLNQNAQDYEWELILNPTVADTFTYANETNSAVQTATGATANTVTVGTHISGGLVKSGNQAGSISENLQNAIHLGSTISGTPDELVLCCRPLSANPDIEAVLQWRELS